MSCNELRDRLLRGGSTGGATDAHLTDCAGCRTFAAKLEAARAALRQHLSGIEPDAAFAGRVLARLDGPADLIGRAALRLLPVALASLLVLAALCDFRFRRPEDPTQVASEPASDDLLVWLAQPSGSEP